MSQTWRVSRFDPDINAQTKINVQTKISDKGLLSLEMPVVTGVNDVRIRLTNRWRQREHVTASAPFELHRPPIINPINPPEIGQAPFADLVVEVKSWKKPVAGDHQRHSRTSRTDHGKRQNHRDLARDIAKRARSRKERVCRQGLER